MKQLKNPKVSTLRTEVSNFLTQWHNDFILDYWWRKKHNVAFGSTAHREMNFIDMFIEYQEDIIIKRARLKNQRKEEEDWLGKERMENIVQMSQSEIDDDYENIDFENYKVNG